VDAGPSGAVVVTGLPPTPAATPNLASASHDTSVPRDVDGSQLPSAPEFAPVHNLQKEMHELSSQFRAAQEQLKQVASLQCEVQTLRSAIDKQAGEFEALRQEHRTFSSVKEEVSALKNELQTLRQMYGQVDLHRANGTIQ
jgi:peptidoglycan hydrolase CwlO-like protein